jgi:hypothetical protein
MTIKDLYADAIIGKFYSLQLMIEYLVYERKVLNLVDSQEKLEYYFQEKFHTKMNEYLCEYQKERDKRRADPNNKTV